MQKFVLSEYEKDEMKYKRKHQLLFKDIHSFEVFQSES